MPKTLNPPTRTWKPGDVVEVTLDLESEEGSLSFKKGRSVYPGAITGLRELIMSGQEDFQWEDVEVELCIQMSNEGDMARLFYPYAEDVEEKEEGDEGGGGEGGGEDDGGY